MNETISLGGCPVIRPEGIYYEGRRVIRFGMSGLSGPGEVQDLLAYRSQWEPFIATHLDLWRRVNERLEAAAGAKSCPPGIFEAKQIENLSTYEREFCALLVLSRRYTSNTDPLGIRPQWNAWVGKSSSYILINAKPMLEWHQSVVMLVGSRYKDELLSIADKYGIGIELPNVPAFSVQQDLISRLESAWTSLKGVIGIVAYGPGETLKIAGNVGEAVAEGLKEAARDIPKTAHWVAVTATVALVVVGGVLVAYYIPRRQAKAA